MQYILWKSKWTDLCQQAAVANLDRDDGDPLKFASVEMLTGTGAFIDAQVQSRMHVQILHQSAHAAREALRQMPEDGKIAPPFTKITQGSTETYMSFLDRLRESIQRSGIPEAARDSVLMSLEVQNANSACKRILMALLRAASIVDMMEACEKVGTLAENAVLMAEAFAAAVKLLVKQGQGDKGPRCFKCGKQGHVKAQC